MHATHDALSRWDRLARAGHIETPKCLPDHESESFAQRTYLRVPLSATQQPMPPRSVLVPPCSATVWLVQLSHLKTGGKTGPSFLGLNALNRKVRLFAAAWNQGREAAAALNKRMQLFSPAFVASVVPVTLGDQHLTEDEVLHDKLSQPLVLHAFFPAARKGIKDKQGRVHQDLIAVDADPGVELTHIWCNLLRLRPRAPGSAGATLPRTHWP